MFFERKNREVVPLLFKVVIALVDYRDDYLTQIRTDILQCCGKRKATCGCLIGSVREYSKIDTSFLWLQTDTTLCCEF